MLKYEAGGIPTQAMKLSLNNGMYYLISCRIPIYAKQFMRKTSPPVTAKIGRGGASHSFPAFVGNEWGTMCTERQTPFLQT
jgi:hypothetical protein